MPCFKKTMGWLDIEYSGDGHEMAERFYIPVLKSSFRYDRISGYFSVDSLVVVSAGLAGLIGSGGRMRLVVGLHDVGPQLRQAYYISREQAERLLHEIGEQVASGLERIEDVFAVRRLEALAWMLAEGLLEIKVAVPKRTLLGLGSGIFHQKRLVLYDEDGCAVSAAGSANETRMAWEQNGENLTVHMSWREGHMEYINRHRDQFEALWTDNDPSFRVFSLPEVVERKLRERYYPERPPDEDPEVRRPRGKVPDFVACGHLTPAARLALQLSNLRGLSHLGLGPVRLFPHQIYAMDFALGRFPHRALIADEVGLGKTIEVGAIVKRLLEQGTVERVLILAPKNVTRQWQEELWLHFNVNFWRLDNGAGKLVDATDVEATFGDSNPFDRPGVDLLVCSWHNSKKSIPEKNLQRLKPQINPE